MGWNKLFNKWRISSKSRFPELSQKKAWADLVSCPETGRLQIRTNSRTNTGKHRSVTNLFVCIAVTPMIRHSISKCEERWYQACKNLKAFGPRCRIGEASVISPNGCVTACGDVDVRLAPFQPWWRAWGLGANHTGPVDLGCKEANHPWVTLPCTHLFDATTTWQILLLTDSFRVYCYLDVLEGYAAPYSSCVAGCLLAWGWPPSC